MDGKAVVLETRTFRGTSSQPVDLTMVEETIADLYRRFRPQRCVMDAWQAALMATRLNARRIPTRLVTTESAKLDRIITRLKSAFARRCIRLAPTETALIEQLESVEVMEGRIGKRDTLRFKPSGVGVGVGLHDDLVVSLGLALDEVGDRVGQVMMDPMDRCALEDHNGNSPVNWCYLFEGEFVPSSTFPVRCASCPGHVSTQRAHRAHLARGGVHDPRTFVQVGAIKPNDYIRDRKFRVWAQNL